MSAFVNDTLYYYWAHNSSGDYYYGYTIADTGRYSTSSDVWLGTYDNDGGYWLYDVYATANYGYNTGAEGYSAVNANYTYYYDAGSNTLNSTTTVSNYGGIGSEWGQLTSGSHEYFGYYGLYEADQPTGFDTLYYFWAHNSSGDWYYGYTIADTGTYSNKRRRYLARHLRQRRWLLAVRRLLHVQLRLQHRRTGLQRRRRELVLLLRCRHEHLQQHGYHLQLWRHWQRVRPASVRQP